MISLIRRCHTSLPPFRRAMCTETDVNKIALIFSKSVDAHSVGNKAEKRSFMFYPSEIDPDYIAFKSSTIIRALCKGDEVKSMKAYKAYMKSKYAESVKESDPTRMV